MKGARHPVGREGLCQFECARLDAVRSAWTGHGGRASTVALASFPCTKHNQRNASKLYSTAVSLQLQRHCGQRSSECLEQKGSLFAETEAWRAVLCVPGLQKLSICCNIDMVDSAYASSWIRMALHVLGQRQGT